MRIDDDNDRFREISRTWNIFEYSMLFQVVTHDGAATQCTIRAAPGTAVVNMLLIDFC